ncbi:MAG: hypothetical protein ACRCZW_10315 [Lactobacillaceae bacterium]
MSNTKRRNTYIFWAIIVILVSILATYSKNIYARLFQVIITIYALYRLLKVDQVFNPQKRQALIKAQIELRKNRNQK